MPQLHAPKIAAALAFTACLALLSACSSGNDAPPTLAPGAPVATSDATPAADAAAMPTPAAVEPTPTPTPTPSADTFAFSYKSDDGYTYNVTMSGTTSKPVTSVANSKPGFTNVSIVIQGAVSIANTTAGRNAPWPNLSIAPVWETTADSPCPMKGAYLETSHVTLDFAKAHCINQVNLQWDGDGLTIPAGGTAHGSVKIQVDEEVADADLAKAVAAAQTPQSWLVEDPSVRSVDGDCIDSRTMSTVIAATAPQASCHIAHVKQ